VNMGTMVGRCASLLFGGLLLSVAGCGGSEEMGGPASCSAALPGATVPTVCIDLVGGTTQDIVNNREQCAKQGNTFALELCNHAGAVGGCRESHGSVAITTWYYPDATQSDIKMLCESAARFASNGIKIEFVLP